MRSLEHQFFIHLDQQTIKTWDASAVWQLRQLQTEVNEFGINSARAQNLLQPITTFGKLQSDSAEKLYLFVRSVEQDDLTKINITRKPNRCQGQYENEINIVSFNTKNIHANQTQYLSFQTSNDQVLYKNSIKNVRKLKSSQYNENQGYNHNNNNNNNNNYNNNNNNNNNNPSVGVKIMGGLKFGIRKLYLYDQKGMMHEFKNAPCLLDFYVYEKYQRQGIGKKLFERMIKDKNLVPQQLAFDRPSKKLLQFLTKYYGLKNEYLLQPNHYMVFSSIFNL
eukprot:TRINITY_DN2967_c1_g1_i3.p1 TRINITY_DN2967_c1_g1~~TRINITY_DN2967_c1_g1_i3.p1  ORF type:complete len:298 (-),score=14.83 TRINITY_DN2967_c1_g1_i3:557-1393(-)